MSVEKLARVLWLAGDKTVDFGGYSERDSQAVAAAILADPGPLLEALAEAGVLREERRDGERWRGDSRDEPGWDHMPDGERRYVTDWGPTDARA